MSKLSDLADLLKEDGYKVTSYEDSVDISVLTPATDEETVDLNTDVSIRYNAENDEFESDSDFGSFTLKDEYDIKCYLESISNALDK